MCYAPGIYLMSLYDLQSRLLIQMGKSKLVMYVQIFGTLLHIFWNYLFVIKLDLGVKGTGISATFTNSILLIGTVYMTELKNIWDNRVF